MEDTPTTTGPWMKYWLLPLNKHGHQPNHEGDCYESKTDDATQGCPKARLSVGAASKGAFIFSPFDVWFQSDLSGWKVSSLLLLKTGALARDDGLYNQGASR